jgi:hypothetical protein
LQESQKDSFQFGSAYSELDPQRQKLVDDWVTRLNEVSGLKEEPGPFYDNNVKLSTKTTFDAVTHALMTTALTGPSGESLGNALDVIEHVESVSGRVPGASGDLQFRIYVRLKEGAIDVLKRSREFRRGADNFVHHKGYPINYREQGGTPAIQISIARDARRADIDVDYRSSGFPAALFNGHLTASNSDVRAGDNYERHAERWSGFQNWWRSFFGIRLQRAIEDESVGKFELPRTPRAGRKNIDEMMEDFLEAWLVDGDVVGAMSYVSPRAYACMAAESVDPSDFDLGMAPFQLMKSLKEAHEALGRRESLDGLTLGVHLTTPGLKVVDQPHHAKFVIYSVPDDVAAAFDCESRMTLGDPKDAPREYGHYFGATFFVDGPTKDQTVALLWAREDDYWKIVSWQVEPEQEDIQPKHVPPEVEVVRIEADETLVEAAKDFLESWLIRKDYDRAFSYLSPRSYACYNLVKSPEAPAAATTAEAGERVRESLQRSGESINEARRLDSVVSAAEPFHPSSRVMRHPEATTFALSSVPDALADAVDCAARARGEEIPGDVAPVYGRAFEMTLRFRTKAGEAPVLRTLWQRESNAWRITVYHVEAP